MDINSMNCLDIEKLEQIKRGKRIKYIRENELNMNKTQLAKHLGISGQFLSIVEEGKGNLVYKNIKKLKDLSGHSADYILFGLDDKVIDKTKECLKNYSDNQITTTFNIIQEITLFLKDLN